MIVAMPERLKELRKAKGFATQQQLADAAGVTQGEIGHLESGRHEPTLKTAIKIARALGVSVEELAS